MKIKNAKALNRYTQTFEYLGDISINPNTITKVKKLDKDGNNYAISLNNMLLDIVITKGEYMALQLDKHKK